MEEQVIVLGASRYSFPNRENGEIIEGTKVHYITLSADKDKDKTGHAPQVANLDYDFYDTLKEIPGVYDLKMTISFSGKKPSIKVNDFIFKKPFGLKLPATV